MQRDSLRFPVGMRTWLWVSLGSLFATGVLGLVLHYGTHPEDDSGSRIQSAEPWLLRLHGLAAFIALMVLGAVYILHVKPAWNTRRNRVSGLLLTCGLILLILSGYGLYYFAGESLRNWTGYVHSFLGIVLPLLVAGHILRGRSRRP